MSATTHILVNSTILLKLQYTQSFSKEGDKV